MHNAALPRSIVARSATISHAVRMPCLSARLQPCDNNRQNDAALAAEVKFVFVISSRSEEICSPKRRPQRLKPPLLWASMRHG